MTRLVTRTWADRLAAFTGAVTVLFAAGFLFILIGGMVGRLLHHPLRAAEELSSLCFVWACFGGAALAYRRRGHIRLLFLPERLAPRHRRLLEQTCHVGVIFFLTLVVVQSVVLMAKLASAQMPISGLPQWLVYLPAPLFCGIMLIFALESFLGADTPPQEDATRSS